MSTSTARPQGLRRLAAIAAILLVIVVVVATVVRVVNDPLRVVAELVLLVVLVAAGWDGLIRTGPRRAIAAVVALATVVALIVSLVNSDGFRLVSILLRIVGIVVAVALAKYACWAPRSALSKRAKPPARRCRRPPVVCCS